MKDIIIKLLKPHFPDVKFVPSPDPQLTDDCIRITEDIDLSWTGDLMEMLIQDMHDGTFRTWFGTPEEMIKQAIKLKTKPEEVKA